MKFKELTSMPVEELKGKLVELQIELIKEQAQVATGTIPKNPSKINQTKKTMARIKTILTKTGAK